MSHTKCYADLCLKCTHIRRIFYYKFFSLIAQGMYQKALDLERSNGKERTESKCRKDKGQVTHDLRYGPGPPAEFRGVSMRHLSHWSGQQQHLLQQVQALGAQEMQWAQALDYRCTRCQGIARPLDGRPQREVQVRPDRLEVVASFCYLGDMLSAAGSCELSTTTCVKTAWQKFKEFCLHATSLSRHVAMCTALVCGVQCSMPVRLGHWQNQTSNICSGMTGQWSDRSAMSGHKMLSPPGPMNYLRGLALRIWTSFWRREGFRWYGHVERSNGTVKTAFHIQIEGKRRPGRPKMTWKQLTERDCREWKQLAINPHDRNMWRSGVRSAMRAASQLSGRGPNDVDVAPVPAH